MRKSVMNTESARNRKCAPTHKHIKHTIPAAHLLPSNQRRFFPFVSKGVIITTEGSY